MYYTLISHKINKDIFHAIVYFFNFMFPLRCFCIPPRYIRVPPEARVPQVVDFCSRVREYREYNPESGNMIRLWKYNFMSFAEIVF
jgi:hypothetical protein